MKLGLTNVGRDFYKVVEIETVEQLILLMKKYKNPLILQNNSWYKEEIKDTPEDYVQCEYELEIYDDYIE